MVNNFGWASTHDKWVKKRKTEIIRKFKSRHKVGFINRKSIHKAIDEVRKQEKLTSHGNG